MDCPKEFNADLLEPYAGAFGSPLNAPLEDMFINFPPPFIFILFAHRKVRSAGPSRFTSKVFLQYCIQSL